MSRPRGGLGRGLAALIPTSSVVADVFMAGSDHDAAAGSDGSAPGPTVEQRRNGHSTGHGHRPATDGSRAIALVGHRDDQSAATGPRYAELPVERIRPNPRNPRTAFDEESLAELEHSVREFGLLQPIVVRRCRTDSSW